MNTKDIELINNSLILSNSNKMHFDSTLACITSVNEAIVLEKIHGWLLWNYQHKIKESYQDGRIWSFKTIEGWTDDFPFLSASTVRRTLETLRKRELLITGNYNKMKYDRKLWYSIDYQKLKQLQDEYFEVKGYTTCEPLETLICSNWANGFDENDKCTSSNWANGKVQIEQMDNTKLSTPIEIINKTIKENNKNIYGEFKNVLLTTEEYEKLLNDYSEHIVTDKIEVLSGYIESNGKKYKSHYATIKNWLRKDGIKPTIKTEVAESSKSEDRYNGKKDWA